MSSKNKVDMINGPLAGKIIAVALPLAAISILQQLFNAADVAVVGRFASHNAIAAVGANTSIINMFVTLSTGLATGGNVVIATMIGRGENDKIHDAVQTVFTMSLLVGLLAIFVGEIFARPLLTVTGAPVEIFDSALLYLRIYLVALFFGIIYNYASAILRSKGDTKRPLYCLIASGIINVILNLIFVIGFHMDVAGVAIATLISNIFCAAVTVVILLREEMPLRVDIKKLGITKAPLLFALRIGLPAGIQGMLFSISNVIIQSAINSFGPECIAGNTAAMNYEFIAYFCVNAFAQTATTFTSQNYGAGKFPRVKKVLWECMALGMGLCCIVGLSFYLGSSFFIGLFTADVTVMSFALIRMACVVVLEPMTGMYEIPSSSLRGMGVSVPPTLITILGSCVFRIIWVNTVFRYNHSIRVLLSVYPVSWAILSVIMGIVYCIYWKKIVRKGLA